MATVKINGKVIKYNNTVVLKDNDKTNFKYYMLVEKKGNKRVYHYIKIIYHVGKKYVIQTAFELKLITEKIACNIIELLEISEDVYYHMQYRDTPAEELKKLSEL